MPKKILLTLVDWQIYRLRQAALLGLVLATGLKQSNEPEFLANGLIQVSVAKKDQRSEDDVPLVLK